MGHKGLVNRIIKEIRSGTGKKDDDVLDQRIEVMFKELFQQYQPQDEINDRSNVDHFVKQGGKPILFGQ